MRAIGTALRREQDGGITIVEMLVVMMLTLLVAGAGYTAIETSRSSSQKTTARQEAVSAAERTLRAIARETHQAARAAVQGGGAQLDLATRVRSASGTSALKHVRYLCSGGQCVRYDCGTIATSTSLLGKSCVISSQRAVIQGIETASFGAKLNGADVAIGSGQQTPAGIDFVSWRMRVRLDDATSGRQSVKDLDPVELNGGVEVAVPAS